MYFAVSQLLFEFYSVIVVVIHRFSFFLAPSTGIKQNAEAPDAVFLSFYLTEELIQSDMIHMQIPQRTLPHTTGLVRRINDVQI